MIAAAKTADEVTDGMGTPTATAATMTARAVLAGGTLDSNRNNDNGWVSDGDGRQT